MCNPTLDDEGPSISLLLPEDLDKITEGRALKIHANESFCECSESVSGSPEVRVSALPRLKATS